MRERKERHWNIGRREFTKMKSERKPVCDMQKSGSTDLDNVEEKDNAHGATENTVRDTVISS